MVHLVKIFQLLENKQEEIYGSGTRSSLLYETIRIVGKVRPKYIIWENVKNVLSKKHKHNFDNYIDTLSILGYNSYYQVLNAKDYGVPQNRERVFTVSIRKDIDKGNFEFPNKEELKIRLKDILENEVEEKYYLKDYQLENIKNSNFAQNQRRIQEKDWCDTICARDWKDPKCVQVGTLDMKGHEQMKRVYSPKGLSPTLTTMGGGNTEPKIEVVGNYSPSNYDASRVVDSNGLAPTVKENHGTITAIKVGQVSNEGSQSGTVYSEEGLSPSLCAGTHGYAMGNIETQTRVRKLTPKECWRLMGFNDEDFEKAANIPTSNTQLYKQARQLNRGKCIRKNIKKYAFKGGLI